MLNTLVLFDAPLSSISVGIAVGVGCMGLLCGIILFLAAAKLNDDPNENESDSEQR